MLARHVVPPLKETKRSAEKVSGTVEARKRCQGAEKGAEKVSGTVVLVSMPSAMTA
jgi:hypothetical protein